METIKTIYKYVYFIELPNPGKKVMKWRCCNSEGKTLGHIVWWGAWWKYVLKIFRVSNYLILDSYCLQDIDAFLIQLNKYQRKLWNDKKKRH